MVKAYPQFRSSYSHEEMVEHFQQSSSLPDCALGLIPPPPAGPPRIRSRGADLKRRHLVIETTPPDRQHRQDEYLSKEGSSSDRTLC